MTTKKPSTASQLKTAKAEVERLTKELEQAKKDKGYAESARDRYDKEKQEFGSELEQMHALLDTFDGVVPRKSSESWDAIKYTAMTRLASWLANRNK